MQKRVPIVMAAILSACGAAATSSDNSADAKQSAQRGGGDQQAELDAFIKEALEMESAVQNGGVPGCFDPALRGRERAVAERLGGVPCGEESSSTGSGGDDWSGLYTGGGEGKGGELKISRAEGAGRYSVAFEIGGPGCGGGVDGTGTASGNRMTMSVPVQSGYRQCRVVLDRQGSALRVSESGDCWLFHGGQCSFDGSYARARSASAVPATTRSAPPARAAGRSASWLVGAWTIRGEPCGGFGTTFDADGTFSTDSEKGTWTLAGNVLTVVTRANLELGEERGTPVRNPRPVRSTILSSGARAFSFRDSGGRVWNMARCQ